MTRCPASWAGERVAARAVSGLWAAAGPAADLRILLADTAAFPAWDARRLADRPPAERSVRVTGPASACAANTSTTAAATQTPPVLRDICLCNATAAFLRSQAGPAQKPIR